MPNRPRLAHIVLPHEQRRSRTINLAPRLVAAASRRVSHHPAISAEEQAFLAWLFQQIDLDASSYRLETLERRLTACLRALRAADIHEARFMLKKSPGLLQTAMSAMLVGVTTFFRDAAVFAAIADEMTSTLARHRPGLFVWSAGCSDGAELYSLAILLEKQGLLERAYLLGTDCRSEAIEQARIGCFAENSLKALPANARAAHFGRCGDGWQVSDALRGAVRWRVANILSTSEPGLWDIICCRNLAMYMRPECIDGLWERLENALRPGGILVLGSAERPLGAKRLSLVSPCIYRRVRK